MAKPRRKLGKSKTDAIKSRTATPTKAKAGNATKKRINDKPIKSIEKSKINSNEKLVLKRLIVKLKRISFKTKDDLETLQAQCKPRETGDHKYELASKELESNHLVMKSRKKSARNITKILLEEKSNQNSAKLKNNSVSDIESLNEMGKLVCNSKSQTRTNRRDKTQHSADCHIPLKTKRFVIKLKKIPNMENGKVVVSDTTLTSCINKKPVARSTKTADMVEAEQNFAKSLHPIETKKLFVRLKRIAYKDTGSSSMCLNVPVIDNALEDNGSKGSEISTYAKLNEKTQPYKQEVPTNTKYAVIKQIKNLSLKGAITGPEQDDETKIKDSKFKDKQRESSNEETNKTLLSVERASFQNLANKSDEIENLLNLIDNEEELFLNSLERTNEINFEIRDGNQDKRKEPMRNIANNVNTTNKFFHRKKQNTAAKNLKEDSKKTPAVTGKRRIVKRRSTIVNHDNTYEFFSQSQTSDSDSKHVDPTADIVRKLIKEGKVRVATSIKGKGKPKFKPGGRSNNKTQAISRKPKQLKNKKPTKKVMFEEIRNDGVEEDHFDNDYVDNDEPFDNLNRDMEIQRRHISNTLDIHNGKNLANDQEGTFSRLARTVLINQAGRTNSQRKNRSELLEKVRSIISTPKNKKSILPYIALQTDLSPIVMPHPRLNQQASPWRVNEDAYLPKTFHFSRSSGNLPSFSSDFMPSTPRKEKPKKNGVNQLYEKSPLKDIQNPSVLTSPLMNIENLQHQIPNLNEPSAISSFSSNDSNAENMPPHKPTSGVSNENDRIFDSKQLPNPRRALMKRSPLKTINILEVVHLPLYEKPTKTTDADVIGVDQVEMFGFEEDLHDSNREDHSNEALKAQAQNANLKNLIKLPTEDLFGFEEYLSQAADCGETVELNNNNTRNEQTLTMHDKLQSLQKLKPPENELQKSVKQNPKHTIKKIPAFDDDVSEDCCGMRQRGIKEMLCSTLLDLQPSTSKYALDQLNKEKQKGGKQPNFGQDVNISELFADPEPETTFNESEAHRTYIRPQKRKRRLKENNFVMLLESDVSEEEEEEDNSAKQQKHVLSRESENIMNQTSKKKRQHKAATDDNALKEFIKEFNEMVKEVESHQLIVENSA